MLGDKHIRKSGSVTIISAAFFIAVCVLGAMSVSAEAPEKVGDGAGITTWQDNQAEGSSVPRLSAEERVEQMEKTLQSIKDTSEKSEERSYQNKMMARELIGYVKIMVVVLVVIALSFPFIVWLLSKKRILGLSGLSQEVSATLLVVEERQAKLANILKEVQGEIDYLHTMSVPDLKNLIKQAETYLEQNEKDLGKAGRDKK
ncbi:MAG: hypothetical protein HY912_21240 [Desulfomonile tiedjei]|uniref:Uncharacterized protein n=1 Tax=Desulfomonile tiedjei TaxID=2358 RepID=A0A9D6Z601_9BACT|nr:hypothetical protein [Desulfomonile tiedjei]